MIKAVIFDFFGVVCSNEYWNSIRNGSDAKEVFDEYSSSVNSGNLSWDSFVAKVAEAKGVSAESVNKQYQTEQIDPRIVGFIESLKPKYKIGLLTNAHHDFIEDVFKRSHLEGVFDEITVSSRVGATKPSPIIYKSALQSLGVEPEESVFIDDIARNTDGAEILGMHTVVYDNFEQMKTDIERILEANG